MSHGIVVWAFVLGAGLLLSGDLDAGSLEPPGPPAPTMKTIDQAEPRTPISSLPFTISSPGSYYLTRDLVGVSGQVGITITSSFVTLDLNGFSLTGVPGSLDGIRAQVAGTEHLAIRNGVIRNWGQMGLSAFTATDVHAEDLRLDANGLDGLQVGSRSIVRHTSSTGNGATGIQADMGSAVIGCTAGGNVTGVSVGANSLVSSTRAFNNSSVGIALPSGSMATDCIAHQNFVGFNVNPGDRVVRSVARANSYGVVGQDRVSIEECTIEANTTDGITIGGRGLVRGNLVVGNTDDGIFAFGNETRIEDNESAANGVGIRVTGFNNLVVKNNVSANTIEHSIVAGNNVGTFTTNPATAGPWANFDL